ncbi:GTP cyclohydrolase 1 [Caprobacter fermentans]|uniref:GTP cyclohydrolase 1 n=1 Tax=Caproicibacter fermentans TaxID=2576756 RepID=A0A6N8I247_9FIRM|nr:GTP cyclohydrolase I FolE [Caproicibacter fermentans]MVB12039.1 GTP cyclohydrolase 1 [Caproicibacter fermentans]OCN03100.1 GTP cyclohydrolase I FolE [Clostridium sp. W14A]QNK42698.1 GTP cyclohydrolase I FolE [Caproicibacter fermentans]
MSIDKTKIEEHIRGLLLALGENPEREGLLETPARVAKMCEERFEGINYTNDEIAGMFHKTFEDDLYTPENNNDLVVVRDIEIFSCCEHHLALMYNMMATVAYIPNGKVLGLSKIVRIADMVSKRLQLQERIGSDIAEIMQKAAQTEDVAVIIEGQHACMATRGIKNTNALTVTTALRGRFNSDQNLMNKLLILCNKHETFVTGFNGRSVSDEDGK